MFVKNMTGIVVLGLTFILGACASGPQVKNYSSSEKSSEVQSKNENYNRVHENDTPLVQRVDRF
tara:strand:- start:973 stop:1164 length:192 start_codon:yes stop_codon:yes gene_type:complete